MKRNTKNTNNFKPSARLVGNILAPVFAIVIFAAVFAIQPKGFAKGNDDSSVNTSTQYEITVDETPSKLPAKWTWERKAINFDHMYPSNR